MFNQADPTFGRPRQTLDTRMKQLTAAELVGLFQRGPKQSQMMMKSGVDGGCIRC